MPETGERSIVGVPRVDCLSKGAHPHAWTRTRFQALSRGFMHCPSMCVEHSNRGALANLAFPSS